MTGRILRGGRTALIVLLASMASQPLKAYDAPWNGGREDITRPGPEPEQDCQSGECGCPGENNTSSPVYTARGYLVWQDVDIAFPGETPVGLKRTWNSFDMRAGLFGRGWMTAQESNIARTYKAVTEGGGESIPGSATGFEPVPVWMASYGRRYRLVETPTGCETPSVLEFTFEKTADGGFRQVYENSPGYHIYSDTGALLESYDDRKGVTVYYDYDDHGRLSGQHDSHGFMLRFIYNDQGFVSEATDQAGRTWRYSYDEYGNLVQVRNPDGDTRDYSYEHLDRTGYRQHLLTDVMDNGHDVALNVTWKQQTLYGKKAMRVASYMEDDAKRHTYSYAQTTYSGNPAVLVTKNTSQVGTSATIQTQKLIADPDTYWILDQQDLTQNTRRQNRYDDRGKLIQKIDGRGNVTRYEYDAAGRRIMVTERAGSDDQREILYEYRDDTDRISVINEFGLRETRYTYDTDLRMLTRTIVDQLTQGSRTWSYSYHPDSTDARGSRVPGKLASVDGPLPGSMDRVVFTYDSRGLLTRIQLPLDQSLGFEYNSAGQRIRETDANGVVTERVYDSRNRVLEETTGERTIRYAYSPGGLLESVEDELGRLTTFVYDRFDRLERLTYPSGDYLEFTCTYAVSRTEITSRHFLADGTLIRSAIMHRDPVTGLPLQQYLADSSDKVRSLSYNGLGDLVEEIRYGRFDNAAGSAISTYSYDPEGRMSRMQDSHGLTTRLEYDRFGHLVGVIDANHAATHYGYSAFGDLVSIDSPDTGTTSFLYDDAGNLSRTIDANNRATTLVYDALGRVTQIDYPGPEHDVTLRYDEGLYGKGRLTSVSDGSGSSHYRYDDRGLVQHADKVIAGIRFTIDYAYSQAGELSGMTYPGGGHVRYNYDAAGRLDAIHYTENGASTAIMSDLSWRGSSPESFRLGNGLHSEFLYDPSGRLVEKRHGGADSRMQQQLDEQGQVIRQSWTFDSIPESADFHYDRLGRLTFDGQGNWHYDYDPAGNRVRQRDSDSGETSYSYEDDSNRMDSRGNQPVTRDAAGNTLSDGRRSYQYNGMNRLSQVLLDSGTLQASYRYNYKGERVRKGVSGSIQLDTRYVYGPDGELLGEYDANGNRIREYLYFRHNGVNELIAWIDEDGSRLASDHTGRIVWRWISEAFGTALPEEDPDGDGIATTLNHRFPGQYFDSESGLHYNYFRYYDPEIGRYITSDPIGLEGGLNTFVYVGSNPMAYIDPAGLEIIGEWVKKGIPQITEVDIVWGNARRPDNWWKFWEHGFTYRSMEHAVDVRVGYSWDIKCFDTCNDDSWNIDGGISESFRIYVPVFTPIHPKISQYTSIANPTYNLLLKPVINESLQKASDMAKFFYSNMTASEVCNLITKGR